MYWVPEMLKDKLKKKKREHVPSSSFSLIMSSLYPAIFTCFFTWRNVRPDKMSMMMRWKKLVKVVWKPGSRSLYLYFLNMFCIHVLKYRSLQRERYTFIPYRTAVNTVHVNQIYWHTLHQSLRHIYFTEHRLKFCSVSK